MIEAFITATISVLLAFVGGKSRKPSLFLLLSFLLLTTFLSIGYYWGNDVATYEDWYDEFVSSGVSWWEFSEYNSIARKEFGYIFINLLLKPLGFWGMRAVLFVMENAIIFTFIKSHVDKKWYWLAVFIYVFNPFFWVLSSSMMRQWLAMCIIILGIQYLLENRYVLFTLFVIIAATIHFSAGVCLLLLPLSILFKNATKTAVYIIIMILMLYFLLSPLIVDYVALYLKAEELYMGYTDDTESVGISSIIFMIIYTVILYYAGKTHQKDFLLYLAVMLSGLILPLLYLGAMASRIGVYFTILTICTIPMFMNNQKVDRFVRIGLVSFVCMYYVYMFILFFRSSTYIHDFGTYKTIIGNI